MAQKRAVTKKGIKPIKYLDCFSCEKKITDFEYIQFRDGEGNNLFIHNKCNIDEMGKIMVKLKIRRQDQKSSTRLFHLLRSLDMAQKNLIEFPYDKIQDESGAAYYLKINNKYYWLPKSQIVIYKVSKKVEIPQWLVEKKGM